LISKCPAGTAEFQKNKTSQKESAPVEKSVAPKAAAPKSAPVEKKERRAIKKQEAV
jgi:hypothetical protein